MDLVCLTPPQSSSMHTTTILSGYSRMLGCGISFLQSLSFEESTSVEACSDEKSLSLKVIWCLALAINAFTAFGVNDGAIGAVVKFPVLDSEVDPGVRHPFLTLKLR
ncbi:hypothetical protein V6N13_093211 [Hibiscus sabdariffa]